MFIEVTEAEERYQVGGRKRLVNINHITDVVAAAANGETAICIIDWPESLVVKESYDEIKAMIAGPTK